MIKKFVILLLTVFFTVNSALAFEGGNVILDLSEDITEEDKKTNILGMGYKFIQDVKEYSDQLEGDAINKDFVDDIRSKYPWYSEGKAEFWQNSIRKGVRLYRWYQYWKDEFVKNVLNKEMPLVVSDDQYEMGDDEKYIESETPIVIHDFKKVVAYSSSEKDQLAAEEKRAKDAKIVRPSEKIAMYKKALLEKDWKKLFGFDWRDVVGVSKEKLEQKNDIMANNIKAAILPKFDGIDEKNIIKGVLLVELPKDNFALLSDYKNYEKMSVDFGESKNLQNERVYFLMPKQIELADANLVQIYNGRFPVYFEAEAKDIMQKVIIAPVIKGSVCYNDVCNKISLRPKLTLKPKENVEETLYATYVKKIGSNIPNERNKKYFELSDLMYDGQETKSLWLEITTNEALHLEAMVTGKYFKYFKRPKFRLNKNKVVVEIPVADKNFNPLGKEIEVWLDGKGGRQYIAKLKAEKMSSLSTTTGNFSLGILWLAFLGGVLVNIMPCVLPVLGLKLLGLSILENFDAARVRKKVVYVCWGILLSFVVLAVVISVLKYMGYSIGWGMQFQNEYFLVALIWCVVLFLAYVWGLVGFGPSSVVSNLLEKMMSKTEMFDVLSGVVLVALSLSCIAPYWGEAFSVALAGNIGQIVATIVFAGLGFAMPQILLLIYPGFVCHIAKMSRFWNRFNLVIFGLLIATIVWLVSILVAQSNLSLVWHWSCYVVAVLVLLGFRKLYLTAVDDVKDEKIAVMLYRRYNRNFVLVILVLVVVSFVDAAIAVKKRHEFIENNLEQKINLSEIEQKVRFGYKILVKVGADWCLTCKYNEALVFDVEHVKSEIEKAGVEVVDVDWTNYQPEVLDFMKKFNRIGVPFYVLYSKRYPSGLVLPEMMSAYDLTDILRK